MDLRDALRALRRNWWLVVAALVVALGGAGLMNAMTVPRYATSVTFFVVAPAERVIDSYQGGLLSQQRVASYSHILLQDDLARTIAQQDGIDLTPAQVQARITSRPVPETMLLEATVTDTDKARSERIAGILSREFIPLVRNLEAPPDGAAPPVKVEVIAGPTLDPVPVSPKPIRNAVLAALLGLLLGAAAALLRQMLDVRVKTAAALGQVSDAPVLAVLPLDHGVKNRPLLAGGRAADGPTRRRRSRSAWGEAIRHLRTNLQFADQPARVVAITSCALEEGKSTTAVNLAITFAEAGHRVALVEADLRRPRVADYLGLDGSIGLSDVLARRVMMDDAVQRCGSQELYVLAAGATPPNPSELLGSRSMAALLERLREQFDVVIVDTPPVLPFTDAAVVAAMSDGALLVVRSGKTHEARVRTAVTALRAVDSRLLGCVLNMHTTKADEGYSGYGYPPYERRSGRVPAATHTPATEPPVEAATSAPEPTIRLGR